jgi:hypothetical protein
MLSDLNQGRGGREIYEETYRVYDDENILKSNEEIDQI